ncbi:MAG: T9SS type A sorting domain-containing protein [Cytophagales bacterium]|nr:T9SS type A sorting domain-containing protein [Cytophagales bacterium]
MSFIQSLTEINQKKLVRLAGLTIGIFFSFFSAHAQAPVVSIPTVTGISTTSATLGGSVTGTLTHRGTRWSTSTPVANSNELEESSATPGAFTQARTAMPAAARIYFVAYARNNADIGITSEVDFVTRPLQLSNGQFTATASSSTTINLVFPSANSWVGSGATAGYLIYRNAGSAPSLGALTDGVAPPTDGTGDKITTITDGTATGYSDTGLTAGTDYYYTIVPFAWNGTTAVTYSYNQTAPQTVNDFTFASEPSGHATGSLTVTAAGSTQLNLSFNSITTSGISNANGYILLIKSSAIVAADLATLVDGGAPNSFGLFKAIINSTVASSYNDVTGLTPNTTYHYAIIPYNRGGDDQTYNFLTSTGFPTGSATTLNISTTITPILAGTSPVISSNILSAGTTQQVIAGFVVTSDGVQTINNITFTYTGLTTQFTNEYIYRATTAGTIGTQILSDSSPDGDFSFAAVAAGDKTINSTPVYYYLVVDVANSVTAATTNVGYSLNQGGVTMNTGSINSFTSSRTFSFNTSQLSDIIFANSGTTAAIAYRSYQGTTIGPNQPVPPNSAASQTLADFLIRDGGATGDPDNKATNVTSITIQLTNYSNVRQIALFNDDTDTEIAGTQQTVSSGTITFTPNSAIVVPDNGTFRINVRASFQNIVTDNHQLHITITGVTTSANTSGFAAADGGGATTTGSVTNVVTVNASKLVYSAFPASAPVNTNFSVVVRAVDSNPYNNLDLDYNGQISLAKSASSPSGTLTAGGGESLTPFLSSGVYTWNQLRISGAGNYTLEASDDAYADLIGDATATISITSSPSNITQPPPLTVCYGGNYQNLGNIVISETDPAGFSSSGTISISLPSGFLFDPAITTAPSVGGAGVSASALTYPNPNVVEFTLTVSGPGSGSVNSITISGLRIRHLHPGNKPNGDDPDPATGNITRLGGTANLAGVISGTALGTVTAQIGSPKPVGLSFTVEKLNADDVTILPTETRFSVNSNPVKLVGQPNGAPDTEFFGPGVSNVAGVYRFNPQTLAPGNYNVTYRHKATSGANCEYQITKIFEVYTTNITGLNPQYCNNSPATGILSAQNFIDTYYPGFSFVRFVYWNTPGGRLTNGTVSPGMFATQVTLANQLDATQNAAKIFDPQFPDYQLVYGATANIYGRFGIWIGFEITNGLFTFTIWDLIEVRPATAASFSMEQTSFCDDETSYALIGNPPNSNNAAVDKFELSPPQAVNPPIQFGGDPVVWTFTASNVENVNIGNPVEKQITYTYIDPSTGCQSVSNPVTIKVYKRPGTPLISDIVSAQGSNVNICQQEPVPQFAANPQNFITYKWYGDAALTNLLATGNSFDPPVNNSIVNGITFYVTKTNGICQSSPLNISVTVNPLPKIDFSWQNPCIESVPFANFLPTELSQPPLTNLNYNWDFALTNTLGYDNTNTGPAGNPLVQYTNVGSDLVRLIASTPAGCADTLIKPVYILPKFSGAISRDNPYTSDFNNSNNWIAGGKNSSWEWGTLGLKGNEVVATRGKGWDTKINGTNNKEEQSWVLSECLNLSSISKPIISLDIFSDTPAGVNGAVLQANVNGKIENDADWITIGEVGKGINWYDTRGISNSPGNQPANDIGWSGNALSSLGKYNTWVTAINKLDTILNYTRDKVVFRIAFGANNSLTDGFAFDNVFIGERTRVVLLENFTNNSVPSVASHNLLYQQLGNSAEIVKVQYHTPFPGNDPVNNLNVNMNNARTAFYGITQAPTVRLDGQYQAGNLNSWLSNLYEDRVLTPSPLELSATASKIGSSVSIEVRIKNKSGQTLPLKGAHIFTTIVQKSVMDPLLLSGSGNSQFEYVARQMLPSPTGIQIDRNLNINEEYISVPIIWQVPSGDAIIVTVQPADGTKEVYQAYILPTPLTPDVVTSIQDLAEHITIYPNPANESFEIELPNRATERLAINLIDPVGRATQQLYFEKGELTKTVSTQHLAQGIYVVQIGSGKTGVVRKKVLVVH